MVFSSASEYIVSAESIQLKIARIDLVINALMDAAIKATANDHLTEYSLDDGQVKISASYKGSGDILKSIESFEKIKAMYLNQLNGGRVFRLMDSKNFRR